MIRLQRARTPDAIPAAVRGRTRIGRNLELLRAAQVAATFEFKPGYWKDGKARLKAETHGKCAYCESKIDTVAHGDVEHFRPKSVYWWLAYCYDNHLYACQICNQVFKKDRFPVRRKM
ncbi:MAG: hypothetical protein HYR60_01540, partial [Acidobacteria bacterium]|nr:hypothetical protein [Acidobacteriota bacterium]